MVHVPGGIKLLSMRFYHAIQNSAQFKTYALFISGISHLIFLDHGWHRVLETAERGHKCDWHSHNSANTRTSTRLGGFWWTPSPPLPVFSFSSSRLFDIPSPDLIFIKKNSYIRIEWLCLPRSSSQTVCLHYQVNEKPSIMCTCIRETRLKFCLAHICRTFADSMNATLTSQV